MLALFPPFLFFFSICCKRVECIYSFMFLNFFGESEHAITLQGYSAG